jgi:hypothetical protein
MPETFNIPNVLIPKTGTRTSSFYVLIAAWVVGGLFTGLFSVLEAKGYLDTESAGAMKGWAIEMIAEVLPAVWLIGSSWMTKAYIEARGRIGEEKAKAMGEAIKAQGKGGDVSIGTAEITEKK